MALVSGERAPAFTSEELEKLVDGALPQYALLYSPPDKQVSAHQKKDIWRAIAKDVRTLGVYHRRSTHCRKRWEDIRRWSKKSAEAQLGMASQRGRGACHTMSPLMFRILAVAYPELDGRSRASQQPQGVVPVVTGTWSAPATRAASVARSHSTDSPPPVKHQKLASARRERGKTPATKAAPRGTGESVESAVTPSKVGKGHKKPGKSGKSSTAEKTAIIPDAQEATTSTSPPAQEDTTSISPAAQEATASTSPAAQEATASTSPAAQKATASTSTPGQEATASTSPAAQEASTSPPGLRDCGFALPRIGAVLTVVFAAGVRAPGRGAGRLLQVEFGVPDPWRLRSSWGV
ncbi:hypothetical protein NDU88_006216 [Pleurodeles waltl]|uniref:Myb/SANT-like DNA-binding domain-containing protein n=1 Tax=Pleurodeles waltl TaxID=8319 RepID=A0AAV7TCV3_PLEWA|nr:hypothetical protein NDU88_006216 [Pleurodeles waltl]